MNIKERNKEIYQLNNLGIGIEDLAIKYNLKEKQIMYIISDTKRFFSDDGFFDVHEFDCWIMPTKPTNYFD